MSTKPKNTGKPGILRIAEQEVGQLRRCFARGLSENHFKTVHLVRKRVKKLRAHLRLIRSLHGEKHFRLQDETLRELARYLAPLRDTAVQLATWQKLYRASPGKISGGEFSLVRRKLSRAQEKQLRLLTRSSRLWHEKTRSFLESVADLPIKTLKKRSLRAEVERTCRRCRKKYKRARDSATNENLHAWRKRTKDLACQLGVMHGLVPQSGDKRVVRLKKLGEILGADHDLAMLELAMGKISPDVLEKIREPIRRQRAGLQKSAFKLGRKL